MGDEEDEEKKYRFFVKGVLREEGSQKYTGPGRAEYLNGDAYEGTYVEGFRRGKGKYTWARSGDVFEGAYEENRKHGFGKMTYKPATGEEEEEEEGVEKRPPGVGGTYIGTFTAGLRGCSERETDPNNSKSEGTFTYLNGDVYVGQWRAGKKHGQGTYSYASDGSKLQGQFENGKITNGRWVLPNGTMYSGPFRYNKPYGRGVWVFKNGNQIIGDYKQKEQVNEDDAGGDDEDAAKKPDPKVWCHFQHEADTAVQCATARPTRDPKKAPAAKAEAAPPAS